VRERDRKKIFEEVIADNFLQLMQDQSTDPRNSPTSKLDKQTVIHSKIITVTLLTAEKSENRKRNLTAEKKTS
jgi:hypothetical protein